MNTFELVFIAEENSPEQVAEGLGTEQVYQQIWIDGAHLDEPHAIDLNALMRSLFRPGEFFIFTCGCGNSGCANIWEGIFVRHEPGVIRWRFRRPACARGFGTSYRDECEDWERHAQWVECAFDRDQMLSDIASALCVVREQTPPGADYSPHGFERKHLDALNPYGRFSDISWSEYTGQSLFFLADEQEKFFLDGRFLALNELGLSDSFQTRFQIWLRNTDSYRTDPDKRLSWLEASRSLMLAAYREGLPADTNIYLAAHRWTSSGMLDSWGQEERLVDRAWLDTVSPLSRPYVCLSAQNRQFQLWMDDSAKRKSSRSGFIGYSGGCKGSFLVPFEIERAMCAWAARMPGKEIPDWALSFHWAHRPAFGTVSRFNFDWEKFDQEGIALGRQLQAILGDRATVMYERPWDEDSRSDSSRIAVASG